MFDPVAYFKNLTETLYLTKDKYLFSTISGLQELEGILSNRKYSQFHVAVDINENGAIMKHSGQGFWNRRPNTIFVCAAVEDYNNMSEKQAIMAECALIYQKFLTAIIKDDYDNGLFFPNMDRVPYYEIPGEFAGGCFGLYFFVTVDNQINMTYEPGDWE